MAERLDRALVHLGFTSSRSRAARLIAEGHVQVNGKTVTKAAHPVSDEDTVRILEDDPWVSRAAHKLLGALADLECIPAGRALDAGASTGGFTQVLRHHGCDPVYAVDVGHDQLADSIRNDPAVMVHEGLNLRDLTLEHLDGQPVDLVVADVSFISLTLLVEPLLAVLNPTGAALLMVKPQFEVGRGRLNKQGVVTDEALRHTTVDAVSAAAQRFGWREHARVPSQLPGPAGNVEYFLHLTRDRSTT